MDVGEESVGTPNSSSRLCSVVARMAVPLSAWRISGVLGVFPIGPIPGHHLAARDVNHQMDVEPNAAHAGGQVGGMALDFAADLQTIAQPHRSQLGDQLLAGTARRPEGTSQIPLQAGFVAGGWICSWAEVAQNAAGEWKLAGMNLKGTAQPATGTRTRARATGRKRLWMA
jgi:hypothetical protein